MKERLDVLLVKRNLAESREKAKAIIMSGNVFVNGNREDKAGTTFDEEKAQIEIKGHTLPYVSRGGLKLEKAIEVFGVDVKGKVCMDIGASTGGFTDCMLQNGADHVYSIDVGRGQLAWKLRQDPRVICMEKTNIRYVTSEQIPEKIDFASVDVSFISLKKVLGPAREQSLDQRRLRTEWIWCWDRRLIWNGIPSAEEMWNIFPRIRFLQEDWEVPISAACSHSRSAHVSSTLLQIIRRPNGNI